MGTRIDELANAIWENVSLDIIYLIIMFRVLDLILNMYHANLKFLTSVNRDSVDRELLFIQKYEKSWKDHSNHLSLF